MNALLGYDRAIVSSEAGTTRDAVEGTLELHGVLFLLTDTAGLREGAGEVEQEGIRRAHAAMERADVIVWVREDEELPPALPEGAQLIVVGSKSDVRRETDCDINVSSVTGEGIQELKQLIFERGFGKQNDNVYLMEERHYRAVEEAKEAASAARSAILEGLPAELYAEDLKRAYEALGLLSGETATEEIISEIFSKFCVGK